MGYTHYFTRNLNVKIDKKDWDGLRRDIQIILDCLPTKSFIQDKDGNIDQITNNSRHIWFNGAEPDSFEDFVLTRNPKPKSYDSPGTAFDCCKTGHRPYDMLVTAVLLVAKDRLGVAYSISSDGSVSDWEKGFRFAVNALQRDLPLSEIDEFSNDPMTEILEKEVNFRKKIQQEKEDLENLIPKNNEKSKVTLRI